ncbi:MAG: type II toxin-antitoxin system death-on-curing family toxin [Actinomycetota bacterium]|nr:type II toxin-antitoxin system death-on-curing family toxin [Actinomycetota bacterium]
MIYLTLDELLVVAERAIGQQVLIRDAGLLESALARPQTVLFGDDAYPDIHTKAAALLHSICANHALVDGNKRLALAGTIAFLGLNGWQLTWTNDEAYDVVIAVASGELDDLAQLAERIRAGSEMR